MHSGLIDAYAFATPETVSRRGNAARRRGDEPKGSSETKFGVTETIKSDYAEAGSLWTRGGDFWAVVGWAFNCSVRYKKRWDRWRVFLEYIINVLEDDWNMASDKAEDKQKTILFRYMTGSGNDHAGRRVVRSIFADGNSKSLAEFKEIWHNETRERRKQEKGREATNPDDSFSSAPKPERRKLDLDADDYGDYLSSSASSSSASETDLPPVLKSSTVDLTSLPVPSALFGGPAALQLRIRLLSLLISLSMALPSTLSLSTLFDTLLIHIRPLPLPAFSALLTPQVLSPLPPGSASSLVQYVARSLLESAAPTPAIDTLDQATLEDAYLPWGANVNGVSANAKVGLCVEALLRMFDRDVGLVWSEELERAVERGVERREERARAARGGKGDSGKKGSGRKKRGKGEEEEMVVDDGVVEGLMMSACSERVRCVLRIAKLRGTR